MRNLLKPVCLTVLAAFLSANTAVAGGYYGGGHSRWHYGYKYDGHKHFGYKHHRHRHSDGDVGLALGLGLLFGTLLGHALSEPGYAYHRYAYVPPRRYRYYRPPRYYDVPRYDYGYRRPRVIYREYRAPPPSVRGTRAPSPCLQEREYQTKVVIGGREVDAYGTACLQADGSWRRGEATLVPGYQ